MKITIGLENNRDNVYFAGQIIYGSVTIEVPSETKTSGLKIKCVGLAKVKWTKRRGRQTVYRHDQLNYFFYKVYLLGSQDGPDLNVPVGIQNFPFVFQLPRNIPSSFIGVHGRIEYYLQATFKRSWKFDAETRLNFSINAIVDLNTSSLNSAITNGGYGRPLELRNQRTLDFCCMNSRPIRFKLHVNQSGFVPGQSMLFNLSVNNLSNRNVKKCSVTLYQGVTYTANQRHTKNLSTVLRIVKYPGVPSGEEKEWIGSGFKIPSLPPTGLGGCLLIDVYYWIEVKVKVFLRSSLIGKLPIVIGNIPVRASSSREGTPAVLMPRAMLHSSPTPPSYSQLQVASSSSLFAESYPDLPPPSYEEAAGHCPTYAEARDNADVHVHFQNGEFVPKYPNYHSGV